MLKDIGGYTWEVWRNEKPSYWKQAGELNREYNPVPEDNPISKSHPNVHPSEWRWAGFNFDVSLTNKGTVEELYNVINQALDRQRS